MNAEQLEFDFADGKDREAESNKELDAKKSLEKLLNMDKINPYGTIEKEVFAEKVTGMSLADMRSLAIRVGVTPTNKQAEMRKRLLNNFNSYVARHSTVTMNNPAPVIDPKSAAYKNLKEQGLLDF